MVKWAASSLICVLLASRVIVPSGSVIAARPLVSVLIDSPAWTMAPVFAAVKSVPLCEVEATGW